MTETIKTPRERAADFAKPSRELRVAARIARLRFYAASGNRIGESHPKAVLTDAEVNMLLELREEGFSMPWLAEKFEIPLVSVKSICSGRTRGVPIARVVRG